MLSRIRLLACSFVVVTCFILAGCGGGGSATSDGAKRSTSDDQTNQRVESTGVKGRWLMSGGAGEAMVQAVSNARESIVVMTKVFETEGNSVTSRLANRLIDRAESGVDVVVITSEDFPVSFFNSVNDKTEEKFSGTPVTVRRRPEDEGYVNSSLLLVDGQNLFGGNYILMPDDVTSTTTNIIQVCGSSLSEKTAGVMKDTLRDFQARVDQMSSDSISCPFSEGEWHDMSDFRLYIAEDMAEPFHRFYGRAEQKVVISADHAGDAGSNRVRGVIKPIRDSEDLEVEMFYQRCRSRCLAELLREDGHSVYQYRGGGSFYNRFALVDNEWFYTGTVDLTLTYLPGRHYQTVVMGRSPGLVKELNSWLDTYRTQ